MILLFFKVEILLIPVWMYLLMSSTEAVIFGMVLALTLIFSIASQFRPFEFYMTYASFGIIANNLNQKSIHQEYHWREIEDIKLKEKIKNGLFRAPTYVYEIHFQRGKPELFYLKPTFSVLHHEFELYVNTYIRKDCFPVYTSSHNALANRYISYDPEESFKKNMEDINRFKKIKFYIQLNITLALNVGMLGILLYSVFFS